MPNGDLLTNTEIEACFRGIGWHFLPGPGEGVWVLPFHNTDTGTSELVLVDNGVSNQGFIGAQIGLGIATKNHDCVHKALCLANGFLALAKLVLDERGEVSVRVVAPRYRWMFHQEMLRHAIQSAMAGATFIRPILSSCLQDNGCDAGAAFQRRVAEVTGQGPQIGPPRPPG